jgi:glycosyltransferase involved in cell wall biosynthesis
VKRPRNARVFASLSNICFHETHTREEEIAWVRENGPFSPELVDAVKAARSRFDRIFFYCYRYYHSFHGVPAVSDRAILVPDAEEDPAIHLEVMSRSSARRVGSCTSRPRSRRSSRTRAATVRAEHRDRQRRQPAGRRPRARLPKKHGLERPFVLYVGRVDRNKGALTLFAYFKKFLEEEDADVDLVLAGKAVVEVPEHPRIRHVGFISEEEKVAALRQCRLLVMPSPYESLSVIVLEAWKLGVPVIANARCKVLAGQCLRSNGGLFYHGYAEFASRCGCCCATTCSRLRSAARARPTSTASTRGRRSTKSWRLCSPELADFPLTGKPACRTSKETSGGPMARESSAGLASRGTQADAASGPCPGSPPPHRDRRGDSCLSRSGVAGRSRADRPLSLRLLSVSTLLHAGLLAAVSWCLSFEATSLPGAGSGVKVFFAEPLSIPPPPPPAAVAPGRPARQADPAFRASDSHAARRDRRCDRPPRAVAPSRGRPRRAWRCGRRCAGRGGGSGRRDAAGAGRASRPPRGRLDPRAGEGQAREPGLLPTSRRAMVQGNVIVELQVDTGGE